MEWIDLNEDFEGTERCPFCNLETNFVINPTIKVSFNCEHCHKKIVPCSLCDDCNGEKSCKQNILHSLFMYSIQN